MSTFAGIADLTGRGLIQVTGEDRKRLIHAMSTNHIEQMHPGDQVYAFFLNAQGRILADAWIQCREDHLLLDTEPDVRQKLFEHLDKFIIADDAYLEDVTEQYAVLTDGDRRWYPKRDEKQAEIARLGRVVLTAAEYEIARLERGEPRYGVDIPETVLVQETQRMQAVRFSKGCYLGQEIMERVRARATVHKHLWPLRVEGSVVPEAAAEFFAGDAKAGWITSAAFSRRLGQVVALGYVSAAYEGGAKEMRLRGGAADGAQVLIARPKAL